MKLLFVGRKFGDVAGGVERMIVLLMNAMQKRGHNVSLLTWDNKNARTFYPLDQEVYWHKLDMGDPMIKAGWWLRLKRMMVIRDIAKKERPDVIIAFQHGPFFTVALSIIGLGISTIAAVRNAPTRFDYTSSGKYRNLWFQTYRLATRITVQMASYRDLYPVYLRSLIRHIPNSVTAPEQLAKPQGSSQDSSKVLLNLGRLCYQKNQVLLLRAFARIAPRFPQWRLRFVGGGEGRLELEALTNKLTINTQVEFSGAVSDIGNEYSQAHLFCFPSLWEGFPNALAEAMAHGLPAIGFSACAGTNELIVDGVNGVLVEGGFDEVRLSEAMEVLMRDEDKRVILGCNAQAVTKQYSPEKIFPQWENLFEELCAR
jgi:GalNAc-alpha-(1->4)-GalNAc-alpha-(1->3)-diNAcBac-PP-undecaprenol alpha-1,4-N-acetyl-D-galactosaminyltransferase